MSKELILSIKWWRKDPSSEDMLFPGGAKVAFQSLLCSGPLLKGGEQELLGLMDVKSGLSISLPPAAIPVAT